MPQTNSMYPKIKLQELLKEKDRIVAKIKDNYNSIKFSHTKKDKVKDFNKYIDDLVKEQKALRDKLIPIKCAIQRENLSINNIIFTLSELKTEQIELKYLTDPKYAQRLSKINNEIIDLTTQLERHNQKEIATFKIS